jgi:hypothetical protein
VIAPKGAHAYHRHVNEVVRQFSNSPGPRGFLCELCGFLCALCA